MFGDYYTPNLMTASPENTMIGNAIDLALQGGQGTATEGSGAHAAPVGVHRRADDLLPGERRRGRRRRRNGDAPPRRPAARDRLAPKVGRLRSFFSNPWGKPRFLSVWTWLYIIWSIAPVLIAVQFSFNDGRSRSTFQGFSTQWYEAIWNEASENFDDTLLPALMQSLKLALLTMPIATALGVGLAIGLARWRGRGSGVGQLPDAVPAGDARDRDGRLDVPDLLEPVPHPVGHHGTAPRTRDVLDLVRGDRDARAGCSRSGVDYEEAAMDLGASPAGALRRVLIPLLAPAILSSFFIVFAISIDDFVISQFLCAQDCTTIPIKIYSAARNAGNPSLNALATIMMLLSLLSITVAVLILRWFNKRQGTGRSAVEDFARFEI